MDVLITICKGLMFFISYGIAGFAVIFVMIYLLDRFAPQGDTQKKLTRKQYITVVVGTGVIICILAGMVVHAVHWNPARQQKIFHKEKQ